MLNFRLFFALVPARQHAVECLEAIYQVEDEPHYTVGGMIRQVHHQLNDEENVNAAAENVIYLLLFFGLFRSHDDALWMLGIGVKGTA